MRVFVSSRPIVTPVSRGSVILIKATFQRSQFAGTNQRRLFWNSSSSSRSSSSWRHHARDPGLAWTSVVSDPKEVEGPEGIPSRHAQIQALQRPDVVYDVLVVGGGATGAGIALDAATRGLQVACLERGDFASETSSRSTKLVWAGIKYMGTAIATLLSRKLLSEPGKTMQDFWGEMKMIYHCHVERHYMATTNPHLCTWLPIVVPFPTWHIDPPPFKHPLYGFFPILAPAVFKFYDALSGFRCPPSYILTARTAKQVFPQLDSDHLKYCAVFYEAEHNDARTNLAIALSAAEHGANICNYVEVMDLKHNTETGKVEGAYVMDRTTGRSWLIRARKVVFAGGPFTDELRRMELPPQDEKKEEKQPEAVRAAWGTHIVLPGYFLPKNLGLLDYNTSDGRFLFIIPWQGHVLVGTTDRKGPAETLHHPPEDEIEWLINECQTYLRSNELPVRRSDVLSAWRGWRPLAADPHAPPDAPVSRDHVISENPATGVFFIAGGKWTTWRQMAKEIVDRIVPKDSEGKIPQCKTLDVVLHGGKGYSEQLPMLLCRKYGLDPEVGEHLASTYGGRAWEVCTLLQPTGKVAPRFGKFLVEGFPYLEAEVLFACREYACTAEDVISRRTRLAFLNKEAAMQAIPRVAEIMAKELKWTDKVQKQQVEIARKYVETYAGRAPLNAADVLKQGKYETPRDVFAAFDGDGNGILDIYELEQATTLLGFTMTQQEMNKTLLQMDPSGKGRVTPQAFDAWWKKNPRHPLRRQIVRQLHVPSRK